MATLWEVPDTIWWQVKPLLDADDAPKATGRPKADLRRALDGIIFYLRTGCQWNHIPKVFGDDSTIHRYFHRWCRSGLFERIWNLLVEECEELGQFDWRAHAPVLTEVAGSKVAVHS